MLLLFFRCQIDRNELIEINRRQTECLTMLEDEYKKLEDEHQNLQKQFQEIQKKNISLEDELNRNSRYISENVDLHVYKNQLETLNKNLQEENDQCEREKFELQEQIIDMEHELQLIQNERDKYRTNLTNYEQQIQQQLVKLNR